MADEHRRLTLRAPAKLNLGLAVTARRGDGFHELETVMARIDLADEIELRVIPGGEELGRDTDPNEQVELEVRGEQASADLPTGSGNLVVRAAEEYLAELDDRGGVEPVQGPGTRPRVRVVLTKRIPIAAGLGGGSSDAAATLRAMSRLLPDGGSEAVERLDLHAMALRLGSDVPFFLHDAPVCLARGRGERLTPLALPELHVVLAKPDFGVPVRDAFESLVGFSPRLRLDDIADALSRGDDPGWRNALQPGVLRLHPEIREVIGELKRHGLRGCIMSGSGSTCFGLAADRTEAEATAAKLAKARPQWWVRAARVG